MLGVGFSHRFPMHWQDRASNCKRTFNVLFSTLAVRYVTNQEVSHSVKLFVKSTIYFLKNKNKIGSTADPAKGAVGLW